MFVLCRMAHARPLIPILFAFFLLPFPGCAAAVSGGDKAGNKLDPALLSDLNAVQEGKQPAQRIDVLIRTAGTIGQAERAALEKQGCSIGSVTGNIVTAKVPANFIPDLVRMPFVVYIEKAKKLRPRANP